MTYCVFRLGDHLLAVDATRVQEVGGATRVTPVAGAPRGVAGVVTLRGEILTALDLRLWFGMPAGAAAPAATVVVRDEREPVCLLVDQICDVRGLDSSRRAPVPTTVENEAQSVVAGAYELDDGVVLEIDAAALVESVAADDRTERR
jgi:purine-binding chemotaxis protein CheW